jgi:hypothetical protein
MPTERQWVGIRAAIASVAASLKVLAREIVHMLARPPQEVRRVSEPASSVPKEFQRQGPPQIWVDYVTSHDPVWFSGDDPTGLTYRQDSEVKTDEPDAHIQAPPTTRGLDVPRPRSILGSVFRRNPDRTERSSAPHASNL